MLFGLDFQTENCYSMIEVISWQLVIKPLVKKIKQARLNSHMTQKQLAEKCGMADSAIRKYESGKVIPKVETVQKIAKALGERWNWFYALTAEDGGIDIRSERLKKEGTYEERLSAACEWLEIIESDAERKTKRIWRADEENQWIKNISKRWLQNTM